MAQDQLVAETQARGQGEPEALSCEQSLVAGFGALDPASVCLVADRLVFHGRAVPLDRHHEGIHPVVVAVLAAVFHYPHPGTARLHAAPEGFEGLRRHVGMAHDVMVLAQQLFLGESADLDEIRAHVRNRPLQVRGGEQVLVHTNVLFPIGHRLVYFHCGLSLRR